MLERVRVMCIFCTHSVLYYQSVRRPQSAGFLLLYRLRCLISEYFADVATDHLLTIYPDRELVDAIVNN
jgi:hypothetical protein